MVISAFVGSVEEIPDVYFDNFEKYDGRAYFLSHFHADHIQGLNKCNLAKSPIFMSEVTSIIVRNEYSNLAELVRPLKLGKTSIVLPKCADKDELHVTITVIPAGHCIGSVMFLLKTSTKTILYTGDFRYSTSDVSKLAAFHDENGDVINLDTIYADITFNRFSYKDFPNRSTSIEAAIEEIKVWLNSNDKNQVVLCTSARYGYESIFNNIFKKIGMKIFVSQEKWLVYCQLLNEVPSVTCNTDTRIRLCTQFRHRNCIGGDNELYILFSAMRWLNYDKDDDTVTQTTNRREVCFATHCSDTELRYFIKYLSPKRAFGFVNGELKNILEENAVPLSKCQYKARKKLKPSPSEAEVKENKAVPADLLRKMFA